MVLTPHLVPVQRQHVEETVKLSETKLLYHFLFAFTLQDLFAIINIEVSSLKPFTSKILHLVTRLVLLIMTELPFIVSQ